MRVGVLFLVNLGRKLRLCRTRIPDSSSDEGDDETTSDELNCFQEWSCPLPCGISLFGVEEKKIRYVAAMMQS
jgi:hypothetical protein